VRCLVPQPDSAFQPWSAAGIQEASA
jgi:hypothetical protein